MITQLQSSFFSNSNDSRWNAALSGILFLMVQQSGLMKSYMGLRNSVAEVSNIGTLPLTL